MNAVGNEFERLVLKRLLLSHVFPYYLLISRDRNLLKLKETGMNNS
jgi:hypothetical protein